MSTRYHLVFGFLVASSLALPAGFSMAANVWTIPGTVNAGGLNNTRFVSDLAVTNPGSISAQMTITLVPAGGTTPSQVTLGAGATVVYRNLLDRVWGAQGAGATQVSSDAPLLIRARTYNTAASGTYGVALPVLADERLLTPGLVAHSLWISQSADGASGYRTNVAVAFPDAGGGAATVTVYDADGNEVGSQAFSLDAAGFQQFGVGGFAGAVSVARAEVQVTRGRAAGYSVVVDNVTGDSSLFSFEDLPTGYQDVVVNGVARANGRNNTFFRTDGRFFNPAGEDALVKVSFHASGSSNPAPVSRTFTVGAGRILDVVDVLGSLIGLPVGSAGAVRFETSAAVAILCRTSNVDPLGVNPGTFGAQQKPTPLLSFLMSGDAGAVVTGIRQGAAFRTNVGFAAGADGADYALTLKSAAGATVAAGTGSLGAFGWTQPNIADLFPTATIPDDATLQVKVTAGSVDVFDSSIDNASGDPVVTPIMPLPVNIASSATIGAQGGSVRSDDGRITLKVPAGAFAAPVAVALTPEGTSEPDALGSAYALTPSALPLAKPALLVFRAAGGPAPALGLVTVSLAVKTGSGTFVATGGSVDPAAGTLSVPISSTSPSLVTGEPAARIALDGPPTQIVPFTNLVFVPDNATVLTDSSVAIKVSLKSPPSAGGGRAGYMPRVSPSEADSTVVWRRPAARFGRIDTTAGPAVTYTAPHRISGAWQVMGLGVSIRTLSLAQRIDLNAYIHVWRRNWRIETEVKVDRPCGVSFLTAPYSMSWSGTSQATFSIADNLRITKNSDSLYKADTHWGLCPVPGLYAFTAITATPDSKSTIDVQFEALNGNPLSYFDAVERKIVILGYSEFKGDGATLTGPNVTPLTVAVGEYSLPFTFTAKSYQEGEWMGAGTVPTVTTHRNRIISIDTP